MSERSDYSDFLGTWVLDPRSCEYQQGEPPSAGRYHIEQRGEELHFRIEWVDAEGASHQVEFSGPPTGEKVPYAGGDLADALSIDPVSPRELNSRAFYRGAERMIAQRQLDASGRAMRVTQLVRFPDGGSLHNVAIYLREERN